MTLRQIDAPLRLVPVVSLWPGDFALTEPQWPEDRSPQQRLRFWRDCLADSGIHDLSPAVPDTFLVALDELTSAARRALLQVQVRRYLHCEPDEPLEPPDAGLLFEPGPLGGGMVLFAEGEPLILPTCCVGLENLEDWELFAASPPASFEMLWTGHPWTMARSHEDRLELQPVSEGRDPLGPCFSLARGPLCEAVAAARVTIESQLEAFTSVASEWQPAQADTIARELLGLV
ncbi:MAG TPA: hypothetical protein DEA08_34790 [Planctomycetes bacterium]|nr:hypothetical protein [Planctomycetota bacterium]